MAYRIQTKTVEVVPARTVSLSEFSWVTQDDSFNRVLRVILNGQFAFTVSGADYDALGQWTDDTIKNLIVQKYGFQLV